MDDLSLHEVAEHVRRAAPEHYCCDSGFGCEACTYMDVADRLDPEVTCMCVEWRKEVANGGPIDAVPHGHFCKVNSGGIAD